MRLYGPSEASEAHGLANVMHQINLCYEAGVPITPQVLWTLLPLSQSWRRSEWR